MSVKAKLFFDEDYRFEDKEYVEKEVKEKVEELDYVMEDSVSIDEIFMSRNNKRVEVVFSFRIKNLSMNSSNVIGKMGGELDNVHNVKKINY